MTATCGKLEQGIVCGEPKLQLPSGGLSPMCYWHRIARTPIEAQIRQAHERLSQAREPYIKRLPYTLLRHGFKWCPSCQSQCPLWYFPGAHCRACTAEKRHASSSLAKYGITPERELELFELQRGMCAICRKRQVDRRLAVDHDHKTNEVRGLLCKRCNHDLLGAAHDSLRILQAAVRYLTTPPAGGQWIPPEDDSAPAPVA